MNGPLSASAMREWTAVRLSHERRPNEEDAAASDLGSTSRNFPSFSRETVGETFSAMKIAAIEVAGVAMRGGVGVVGDEERAILDALNALRHRYTYVFTTGGIGPTHGDITADAHSQGRGTHPQQGVGGAWLLDRQCDRDGWCALDHAGDAR